MNKKPITMIVAAALMMVFNGNAMAAEKNAALNYGKHEYQNNCILCHGADGRGNGSVVELLKAKPADLTILVKGNNGVFPYERIYATIDGREAVKGHGDREMPAWGERYGLDTTKAAEYYRDVPYDMDMYARSRIVALIDYLQHMQRK